MRFIYKLLILILVITKSYASISQSFGYIAVDGGKLYYQKFAGTNDKEPIIVLHGGPGLDSSYLLPQMAELANNNEVIFYDQRGSGKSLGFVLDPNTINIDTFVEDLEDVRRYFNAKKMTLVGHSWGGLLAMAYAIKYQENLNSLVLVSSAPANTEGFNIFITNYLKRIKPLNNKLEKIEKTAEFKEGNPSTVLDYYRTIFSFYFYNKKYLNKLSLHFTQQAALDGFMVANIFGNTYLNNYDLTTQLQDLKVPVTIIHGANDIVPIETARMTQAAIPGSKLIVLKQCDHFPYIEKPKEFFASFK